MLWLVLLYFIGKKFYELADDYKKNKWGFGVLGVVTYFIGFFISAAIIGVTVVIAGSDFLETINDFVLELILMPFGLLSCYGLYYYLEKTWKKQKPLEDKLIDQIGNS
ncbi:hypothetical protein [Tenacibaculum sp. E3R01]|uniref:hypothetical protein n=1 Tax=Tenacibaculum TaxID=104267 RepID=UPI000DE84F45|nr:hypothetical protein [Tenacibaculum sp. E3R01]RBW58228.1 hypothetical protein DS884_10240 [Tenacibaculum sp. E3R01]